ncbi:MAG: hypothetical protein ACTHMS_23495 [Jatrophihabitans sp.]|uniref:hypothetical protein n=1 Tax=Jatrophihabitans sp. TaxID=1932789 RepID=UPI003F7EECB1
MVPVAESPPTQEDEVQTRPFADVLQALQRGKTHRELSSSLQALTSAVVDTHRKGTLTLKLTLSINKAGMIEVDDAVSLVLPKQDRTTSLFFPDKDRNLVRDDPNQLALPVGPVRLADEPTPAAAKVVGAE